MRAQATPSRARASARFFKTAPGEYGHGDKFLGLSVPQIRALLRECEFELSTCEELLRSPWHEARLLALLAMVQLYQRGSPDLRDEVFRSYLANTDRINNWDLVDSSAEHIVGAQLFGKSHALLDKLARSPSLWERRIAIIATFYDIKKGRPHEALRMAKVLLRDEEDLMHKAVGWMLREVGKRCDAAVLRSFLKRHAHAMPRTALRYAIEHFSKRERATWLSFRPSGSAGRLSP